MTDFEAGDKKQTAYTLPEDFQLKNNPGIKKFCRSNVEWNLAWYWKLPAINNFTEQMKTPNIMWCHEPKVNFLERTAKKSLLGKRSLLDGKERIHAAFKIRYLR